MKRFSPLLRVFLMMCICLSMLSLLPVRSARAATITVTSLADSGPGTLRNAIATAIPGDIITFSVTGTIILTSGQLTIPVNLTINGPGASLLTINGSGLGRIFDINPGLVVSISDLTVTNGSVATDGGGIRNQGTLTLTNMVVNSNVATIGGSRGGGIMNLGVLTVNNSQVNANTAKRDGGGIYSDNGTTLNLDKVIVSGNSTSDAGGRGGGIAVFSWETFPSTLYMIESRVELNSAHTSGGGIAFASAVPTEGVSGNLTIEKSVINGNQATYNLGGRGGGISIELPQIASITNTTISSNTSVDNGGGMYLLGATVSINNVTIASNTGLAGGGVYLNNTITPIYSTLNAKNSIIANNIATSASPPAVPDCYAPPNNILNSQDYNLIRDRTACLIGGTETNNIYGLDPVLGPLAYNGGLTKTHALQTGSPAIDSADNLTCAGTDQRLVSRPRDGDNNGTLICDMGAFERKSNVTVTYRSAAANDGWILESTETSGKGGSVDPTATTFRLGDDVGDKQYRAILSFNTASLPNNATIIKATLKIRKQGLIGTDPFTILGTLRADIRKPYFGATIGLVNSDFQAAASRLLAGTFATPPVSNWYSATIVVAGHPFINLTSTTQFRLRFVKDDNNDNGADYMKFYSSNASNAATRPMLIVEYYVP